MSETARRGEEMIMNVLLFGSLDGQDNTHAALYPNHWTPEHADEQAVQAFTSTHDEHGEGWTWEDYALELEKRGFVVPGAKTWKENPPHGPTSERIMRHAYGASGYRNPTKEKHT